MGSLDPQREKPASSYSESEAPTETAAMSKTRRAYDQKEADSDIVLAPAMDPNSNLPQSRTSAQNVAEVDIMLAPKTDPNSRSKSKAAPEIKVQTGPRYSSDNSSTSSSSSSSSGGSDASDPSFISGRRTSTSAGSDQRPLNIDNPLGIYSRLDREQKVVEFIRFDDGLQEFDDLLMRGAIHAAERDPRVIFKDDQDGRNLTEAQKDYLRHESTRGSLEQSKNLLGSLFSTCLAGMIQGWTQSAMNGSNLGMVETFNIDLKKTGGLWVFGVTAAVPFIVGGIIAPLISDPLQEHYLGRRGAIAIACIISVGATVGQALSQTRAQLIGCRVLTGITLAAKASAAPLLTAEVAPNHLRGNLLATWQLSDAFGIFLGFSANLAVLNLHASPNITWRIQTITVLIPTVALLFVVYLLPESPRFLMKRGRFSKALESFILLRPKPAAAIIGARDFIYAHFQLETESTLMNSERKDRVVPSGLDTRLRENQNGGTAENGGNDVPLYHVNKTTYLQRLAYFWRVPRARRALTCAATVMVAQQLTGINTIMFLSATLINDRNGSDRSGAWVGFGLGLSNFIFGLPAFYYGDIIGRATLLLLGFPPMCLWMLMLAISFGTGDPQGSTRPVLFGIFTILFAVFYSPTAGTSPFAISAEVFPLVIREVGHSLAVAVNFVLLGVILLVFPIMSNAMGGYGAGLGLFAGLNVLAFILCFLFVPETKGRTLEELQFTFDLPTRVHIRYRVKYITKWFAYRFALPVGLKLGLYKKKKLRHDRNDFKHRLYFFRWGREEVQRIEARGAGTGDAVEQKTLFYPFGVARIKKPGANRKTTDHDVSAPAAEAPNGGERAAADAEKL